MSEKVVLPKFNLPGQGPHPAVKALMIVGGVLVLSMVVLGGALWHRHSQQVAAEDEAKALAAARTAEALAAVEAAKAKAREGQSEGQSKVAADGTGTRGKTAADGTGTRGVSGTSPDAEKVAVAANESHHKASSHHHAASAHAKSKPLAKGESHASAKSSAASNKKKDDAIDKLLAQFK